MFFLVHTTYQKGKICTKLCHNIPNDPKIFQRAIKYAYQHYICIHYKAHENVPEVGMKIHHLATPIVPIKLGTINGRMILKK
jgi:hypothetical protein